MSYGCDVYNISKKIEDLYDMWKVNSTPTTNQYDLSDYFDNLMNKGQAASTMQPSIDQNLKDYLNEISKKSTTHGSIIEAEGKYFFKIDGDQIELDFDDLGGIGKIITAQIAKKLLKDG